MAEYIIRRTFQMTIVFFLFLVFSYLLFNAIPGNAFSSLLLNPNLPPDAYQRVLEIYGLDKPLLERTQMYIVNFFKGDFGYSYKYFPKTPIELIAERLPRTLMLFSIVNIVAFLSIIQFAAYLASRGIESLSLRRNIRFGSLIAIFIGSYFYWNNGEALIQKPYASDIAYHMILPVMVVTVVAFAGTALLTRTTMMEVLKEDYILTARAKGISQKRIRDRHAARTALLPVVTSFIFTIVTIIDGSVLTEQIFSWPGMGQLLLQSVLEEDIPVAMATFSFVGVFALIAHLLADVSYSYLDPRIRIKSQG